MVPVSEFQGKDLGKQKQCARRPWTINYEEISGNAALQCNAATFIQKPLAKFYSYMFSQT